MNMNQVILQLPKSVRKDVLNFRAEVKRFKAGEIKPIAFKAYRVPMGVYEQREDGQYMVRVRLGGGVATPNQLRKVSELSKKYGNGILHITTRQDIQIHNIELNHIADVHEGLLEVGLAARGGGGNTVRNVSASPRSGVDPEEAFDVRPFAINTAEYLLQFKSSYNLPRKYKIAFSSTSKDTAFASVADLGLFAKIEGEKQGFKVYAGGGLGNNPKTGVLISDWIKADEVLLMAEAVKQVFDAEGDRSNKHAARLRYVVMRLGEKEFSKLIIEKFEELKKAGLEEGQIPQLRQIPSPYTELGDGANLPTSVNSSAVLPEKKSGFYSIRLNLLLGDISADNLVKLADIAEKYGERLIRTSQQQDLFICALAGDKVEEVLTRLGEIPENILGDKNLKTAACAGASTCKLGLCLSRNLALAIGQIFAKTGLTIPPVRISGCPNSCGNHHVAAIGFEGKARRIEDKLMPFYEVLCGGSLQADESRLAEKLGAVPAKVVPELLLAAAKANAFSPGELTKLVEKFSKIPSPIPEEFYIDWGSEKAFSLAGRGPGECSVGTMDIIRVDIDAAKVELQAAAKCSDENSKSEHLYKALISSAQSLMPIYGLEPKQDREVLAALVEQLVKPKWVAAEVEETVNAAFDWKLGDRKSFSDQEKTINELLARLEVLFASLDASLKFRVEPLINKPQSENQKCCCQSKQNESDLRGVTCPLNFVKAKVALEKIPIGDTLEILLDHGEPEKNVPDSFAEQGQKVLSIADEAEHVRVKVKRVK